MKVLRVSNSSQESLVAEVMAALLKGKIVVCPTDTVYGLVADAMNKRAVQKIFRIKKRRKNKPLAVFVKDIAMAKSIAEISPLKERLLKKSWPGKVTVVLKKRKRLPEGVGTEKTIGMRISKHKLISLILEKIKRPLVQTSANLAGKPPLLDSKKIAGLFLKKEHVPDMLVDAGELPYSSPSKVIDITKTKPKVLRK